MYQNVCGYKSILLDVAVECASCVVALFLCLTVCPDKAETVRVAMDGVFVTTLDRTKTTFG